LRCKICGRLSYSASDRNKECPYCGGEVIKNSDKAQNAEQDAPKIPEYLLTKEQARLVLRIISSQNEDWLAENFPGLKPICHLGKFDVQFERLWLWESDEFKIVTFDEGNGECHIVALFPKEINRRKKGLRRG